MSCPVASYAQPWSAPGEGPRARIGVVVSHGFTGNPSSVRAFAEALAARGFRIELPRLPGHGTSVRDMARTRYDDWRRTIADARDRLARECDAVVLSGLSMGGTIVLDLAGAEPDRIAGAIAINPALLDRHVEMLPLERSYHLATLDYDLDLLVERAAAFVDRVARKPATATAAG